MTGLTKKRKTYYALFPMNGKTKWKRIGIIPYKDALKALKDLEDRFEKERLGLAVWHSIQLSYGRFPGKFKLVYLLSL